jgi:AcrR family transcriptional regulator
LARSKNKENDILAAAIKIFLTKGFSKTNVQDIADEARIGKGTIYDYFKSKDDLFVQALKFDNSNFIMEINQKIFKEESFFKKLIKLIELSEFAALGMFRRMNYYITNEISELNPEAQLDFKNFMKGMRDNGKNLMCHILEQGIEEGEVENTDIDLNFVADVIVGMVIFHCQRTCYESYYSLEQRKEENEKFINFLMNGIGRKQIKI